jgi:hypothetical protein
LTEISKSLDKSTPWYIDSGATRHVTGDRGQLDKITGTEDGLVKTVGGESHRIIGTTKLYTTTGGIYLCKILYVPSLKRNLNSVVA